MTYLLRNGERHRDGNDLIYPAETFRARFEEIRRQVGRIEGLGRVVEGTGQFDRTHVRLVVDHEGAYGERAARVSMTSDGVRSALRRMRPDDERALTSVDARIADLREQLAAAGAERRALLHAAFKRGDRVLAPEVIRVADGEQAAAG